MVTQAVAAELAARARCHDGERAERGFLATPRQLQFMRRWLSTFLTICGVREASIQDVLAASGEALANSVEHAYHGAPERLQMKCYCCRKHGAVLVGIQDYGKKQQPEKNSRSTERGFGFTIMRSLAEDVHVRSNAGTAVILKFRLDGRLKR